MVFKLQQERCILENYYFVCLLALRQVSNAVLLTSTMIPPITVFIKLLLMCRENSIVYSCFLTEKTLLNDYIYSCLLSHRENYSIQLLSHKENCTVYSCFITEKTLYSCFEGYISHRVLTILYKVVFSEKTTV